MARKLLVILVMVFFVFQAHGASTKLETPQQRKELIDKKIEEYDAKLSEYLHIPIKKFSSIILDISDYIYAIKISPIDEELKHLHQELADVKNDLRIAKNQILTLTRQVETILHTHKDAHSDNLK